jgi:hypothetical protein
MQARHFHCYLRGRVMQHPEYKEGAYLFSPVSDNRPARFWPILVAVAVPLALMLAALFLSR